MADQLADYRTWVAAVKASGGVPTAFPGSTPPRPAARYTAAQIAQLQAAKRLGPPVLWAAGKQYGYYLAPPAIASAAQALGVATAAETAAGADKLKRQWFGNFAVDFGGAVKKWALLGLLGYAVLRFGPSLVGMMRSQRGHHG